MGSDPFYDNVRFRWIAAVGEGLLNTESGRSNTDRNRKLA